MICKRYSLDFTFMDGKSEHFDCTAYRRKDGVYEIYYSQSEKVVMDFAKPDFEIPVVNVKMLFKDDVPVDER